MARLSARGVWMTVALLFAGIAMPRSRAGTTGWRPVRLYQVDYVSADEVAAHYGLKMTWLEKKKRLRLENGTTKIELEVNDREMSWNGLRVFLSETVAPYQDSLCLSLDDVRSTVEPLMRPRSADQRPHPHLIAIDAGHGGNDSGTRNQRLNLQEKTFTLDVALRLKIALEKLGYRTLLTRKSDHYVALEQRPAAANRARADLFISIHFNSIEENASVRGVETYSFTPAGQRSTVAESHRAADEKAQPGNRTDHWNLLLGAAIQRRLVDGLDATDRGVKRARFVVLRTTQCPAVLVEGGFLSNSAEARKLSTASYRERIARAIAGGVRHYVSVVEASGTKAAE
ncbi:MAG TPA: N-acetylmuramoyl-L-alanine amidase [Lacunisphaera sp.]